MIKKWSWSMVLSSVIISCSIITASFLLASEENEVQKGLIGIDEAAQYMNMPIDVFSEMIEEHKILRGELLGFPSFNELYFIPYYFYDKTYYFNKKALDKWIEFNMNHDFPIIPG